MQFKNILSSLTFHQKIGIDLGSSRVRMWTNQHEFGVDEPSVIAVDPQQGKVMAVGREAAEMSGRVAERIEVHHPIQGGAVHDAELAQAMIRVMLQKLFASPYFFRPTMMVSVPSHISEIQKEILVDLLYGLGAREVLLVDQLLATAIGAGVPVADASGSFVLQLGSGVTEGGITSLGSLVTSKSTQYAGEYLDIGIQRLVRQETQIEIGLQVAEMVKKQLATFVPERRREMMVSGRDLVDAVPKEVALSSDHVQPLLKHMLERHVRLARSLFEDIPPELTNDIIDKGILLSGGVAQIEGIDLALTSALGVPVSVVEKPEQTVIHGIAQILQNLDLFKESIGYRHEK